MTKSLISLPTASAHACTTALSCTPDPIARGILGLLVLLRAEDQPFSELVQNTNTIDPNQIDYGNPQSLSQKRSTAQVDRACEQVGLNKVRKKDGHYHARKVDTNPPQEHAIAPTASSPDVQSTSGHSSQNAIEEAIGRQTTSKTLE